MGSVGKKGIAFGAVMSVKLELVDAESAGLAIGDGGGSRCGNSMVGRMGERCWNGVGVMSCSDRVAVIISGMMELEEIQCLDQ